MRALRFGYRNPRDMMVRYRVPPPTVALMVEHYRLDGDGSLETYHPAYGGRPHPVQPWQRHTLGDDGRWRG